MSEWSIVVKNKKLSKKQKKLLAEKAESKALAEIAKREREALAEIAERKHVQNMIEKWGAQRWYTMVWWTEDDCKTAERLRGQEEERQEAMWKAEEQEEERCEEEREQREIAQQKYIDEQTSNMSEIEAYFWKWKFERERIRELEEGAEAE
jgi:hypothetical protein